MVLYLTHHLHYAHVILIKWVLIFFFQRIMCWFHDNLVTVIQADIKRIHEWQPARSLNIQSTRPSRDFFPQNTPYFHIERLEPQKWLVE